MIGLVETHLYFIEDHGLEYVRKIICNVELMYEDVALLGEEDRPDFLVYPNLLDRLEVQESSTDGHFPFGLKNICYNLTFRKVQGSWINRNLTFYCMKDWFIIQH